MNKNVLTLLGCSGSLAIMLTAVSVATADTTKPDNTTALEASGFVDITFTAPRASTTTSQDVAPSRMASPESTVDATSDTISDLAIAKFRCDCNPCRMAVMQLLQTGQLSL